MENFLLETYERSADYIRERMPVQPEIALVLGSGLGYLAERVEDAVRLPYAEIPGFPRATVASHAGVLVLGRLQGRAVAVLSGRFHCYEGYDMETAAYYVRVLSLLGVRSLLLTNAAGGVNPAFRPGDFMLITDHMKFTLDSPSRGRIPPVLGSRFFDLSRAYTPRLQAVAQNCAKRLDILLHSGVYFFMAGPQFETPAEIRAIRLLGGDAVGMSTVPEVIAAAQCGMEVLGISCITNLAAGMLPETTVSDEEVTATAATVAASFGELMTAIVQEI